MYLDKICILQFWGKMLYICNWVSPKFTFQTVYIRTEHLLFILVGQKKKPEQENCIL